MSRKVKQLIEELANSQQELVAIAESFCKEIENGLTNRESSLKMLPAFIRLPTGKEEGIYLGLDFGGTNIRIQEIGLGKGKIVVLRQHTFLLKDEKEGYDYTLSKVSGKELFDFIAKNIKGFIDPQKQYLLGHTFSFPCYQQSINQAVLINWTKEIRTHNTEGHEVTELLYQALKAAGAAHVYPTAVINDTVGTLLSAAYTDKNADIGSICGTGHNTCYFEPNYVSEPMILNLESGNFSKLPLTELDHKLDATSSKPGQQLLEKTVSGRYLGELVRLLLGMLAEEGCLKIHPNLYLPYSLTAYDLAAILQNRYNQITCSPENYLKLRSFCQALLKRAVAFIAATYKGILLHIDPKVSFQHTIAIDGSLYEKMPYFQTLLYAELRSLCPQKISNINIKLSPNGSGIGAGIAAAIVKSRN